MAGIITTYKINKRFYTLLSIAEYQYEEEVRANINGVNDKDPENLYISFGDKELETPLRLFHLQWIGNMNLGYAVIKKDGQYILVIDRYIKNGEPEYHPFNDGSVEIYDVLLGKKNENITFRIK